MMEAWAGLLVLKTEERPGVRAVKWPVHSEKVLNQGLQDASLLLDMQQCWLINQPFPATFFGAADH